MQNATTAPPSKRTRSQAIRIRAAVAIPPRPWLQDTWLWILLVGPLVAPLFAWLGWPILKPFADAIYLIGEVVCPKADAHLMFLGYPMAVCSSCWAAVFGLWTIRLLYGRAGEGFGSISVLRPLVLLPSRLRQPLSSFWARWQVVPSKTKLAVLAAGFLPWAFDVAMWDLNAWSSPQIYMIFAGYLGGLVAGALILPAASEMRARLARSR
jgi:hypothetical protein